MEQAAASVAPNTTMPDTLCDAKKTVAPHDITHHGVCRDCPDEWLGNDIRVHYQAELHSLIRGHRTEVGQVQR